MNKFYVLYLIIFLQFIICTYGCAFEKENIIKTKYNKKIELKIDLKEENTIQNEVDDGHQPWRLAAVDVAYEAIVSNIDNNALYENCKLVSETNNEATIKYSVKKEYLVIVKKIVRPNNVTGIWTAISIEECGEKE